MGCHVPVPLFRGLTQKYVLGTFHHQTRPPHDSYSSRSGPGLRRIGLRVWSLPSFCIGLPFGHPLGLDPFGRRPAAPRHPPPPRTQKAPAPEWGAGAGGGRNMGVGGSLLLQAKSFRRRPTLPGGEPPSTIGAGGFHDRVRDGNGWVTSAMAAGKANFFTSSFFSAPLKPRALTAAQRDRLDRLVPLRSAPHGVYTRGLSTWSSSRGLSPLRAGNLILGWASRLDAFSASPVRTWLPSAAPGGTTGTPLVRPSRSSRTRDSSPQVSDACDG